MQISKQWSVSDIVTVTVVLFGILASWFALNSDVKQLSREIALIRSDLKKGLESAVKDRELIRKEMSRLADQLDRLNQNYIEHLSFHHGNAPKTPPR